MPIEKSAGAVIFREKEGKNFYLLLHYPGASHRSKKDYWDFPKGHIEKGETEKEALTREIFEETGIKDIQILEGFKKTIKYFFRWQGKTILKFVVFYLVKTKEEEVKISFEHIGFEWLPFKEALERLTHKTAREVLEEAHNFIIQNNQTNS